MSKSGPLNSVCIPMMPKFLAPNPLHLLLLNVWLLLDKWKPDTNLVLLDDWLIFTLGAAVVENMPVDAVRDSWLLFLNVLFVRYLHQGRRDGEELAYKLLETAQMANFHKYFHIYDEAESPPEFNWDHEIDQDPFWCRIEEDGNNSAWEDEEDEDEEDEEDESRMDVDDAEEKDNDTSGDYIPSENLDEDDDTNAPEPPYDLPEFVACRQRVRRAHVSPTQTSLPTHLEVHELPHLWAENLKQFFFSDTLHDKLDPKHVVKDLVAMRRLKPKQYDSEDFRNALRTSELFQLMQYIAKPGNLLETSHPDVEESFRWHNWKLSYAELICDWVSPTVKLEDYKESLLKLKPDPEFKFTLADAQAFLDFINRNPRMQPWGFNPMAVYLFVSEHCFTANCDLWLVPCLRRLDYPKLDGWNPAHVYQMLMQLPLFKNDSDARYKFMYESLDSRFHVVLKPKKGSTDVPPPKICYIHPFKQLNMRLVKFRKRVYERCGKDIVRFVYQRPDGKQEIVSGVRFKPFSKKTLARLINNHRLVKIRAIRRRDMLHRWRYGTMTAAGSRQPAQGRKGDVYGPYACHRGDTPDDIKALFREAVDADVLVEAANTIAPGLKKEINDLTRESKLNYLGRTGLTNFACTNYISCIHPDTDHGYEDVVKNLGKKDGCSMDVMSTVPSCLQQIFCPELDLWDVIQRPLLQLLFAVKMLTELGVVIIYVPLFNMYDKITEPDLWNIIQ
ncbi:hypothetical protein DFH08DRAFT_962375 [Mycena albidolilacea]|uniref:Uncharacterized protein n=1 Tax=Mycena albidolilacea TaxID=1033008 RepID=A0AAD7ENL1_9AGAR|nr:hypothetical protein DFH08DRAFT_962375 [Mycena albidolilacea]